MYYKSNITGHLAVEHVKKHDYNMFNISKTVGSLFSKHPGFFFQFYFVTWVKKKFRYTILLEVVLFCVKKIDLQKCLFVDDCVWQSYDVLNTKKIDDTHKCSLLAHATLPNICQDHFYQQIFRFLSLLYEVPVVKISSNALTSVLLKTIS